MENEAQSRLMLGNRQIEGARKVTATIRPYRIAYLVDPADPAIVQAAVGGTCLAWGGQYNFLIPCMPGGRPDGPWAAIFNTFDPDITLDLVGADPTFGKLPLSFNTGPILRWLHPLERWWPAGACVFAALGRWARVRPEGIDHVLTAYNPLDQHQFALMLAYRFGVMAYKELEENWKLISDHWAQDRHLNYLRVNAINSAVLSEDDVVELLSPYGPMAPARFSPWRNIPSQYWTLPTLTTIGVGSAEPAYSDYESAGRPPPESPQTDEAYYHRVVIVGEPSSVADLCLAWNRRAQRMSGLAPLWLSPSWLSRADIQAHLTTLSQPSNAGLSEGGSPFSTHSERRLHLVSASLGCDALNALASDLATAIGCPVDAHGPDSLDRFFTPAFRTGVHEDAIATFRHGIADVVLPDQRQLADLTRADTVQWVVKVDGYSPPRRPPARFDREHGPIRSARIAKDGISGGLGWLDPPRTLVSICTYSGFEVIEGAARSVGCTAQPSDKARIAAATLNLVGSDDGLSVLASSLVFKLIRSMSRVATRQAVQRTVRAYFQARTERPPTDLEIDEAETEVQRVLTAEPNPDRQFHTWSQLSAELAPADEAARRTVVRWLSGRGILLRGTQIKCPQCNMKGWYLVDRLGSGFTCDGCRATMPTPFEEHGATWSYRLNELMASAVDQGVLAQLLAARRLVAWSDLTGYVPGVDFKPVGDDPLGAIEVDFLALKAGRWIIGEAKMGSKLDSDEIERLGSLARRIDASRLVFATPATFADRERVLAQARAACSPIRVSLWEAEDLLDRRHTLGDESLPPANYLQWAAWRVNRGGL